MNIPAPTPEDIAGTLQSAFERLLAPIAESVGQIERLKRREYLSPEEVELVYGLKPTTLANRRIKAKGPEYVKVGEKILYKQKALREYLEAREVRTTD